MKFVRLSGPPPVNAELGYSLASSGDTNADGHDDILLGAHYYDHGQTDEGAAFGLEGRPGETAWTPEVKLTWIP